MSEFTPTFHAVIDPHPTPVVSIDEDEALTPLAPTRQNASIEYTPPEHQQITKRPPHRPVKPDPGALLLEGCDKRKVHFDDELPPVCGKTPEIETIFYALASSFAVGAIVGTMLSYAFSRRVVEE